MSPDDPEAQAAALTRARRIATGLLSIVGVLFLVAVLTLPDDGASGYLRAAFEAGLVGGLADWFAVVALFRHPMGIPIPHTAVIPKSKDGLGANLAGFVEGNFLSEDQVRERIADPRHVERLADWLATPANADRVVARIALVGDALLDAVDTEALVERATTSVRARLRDLPTAELAGQGLQQAIETQKHTELVTAALEGVADAMVRNRSALRKRLGQQSPSWVPAVVDDLVFEQAESVGRTFLRQLAADPEHELRGVLDQQLLELTHRLQKDPGTQHTIDDALQDVLSDELVRRWIRGWWDDLRRLVDEAAGEDERGEQLRSQLSEAVVELGLRLRSDEQLSGRAHRMLEAAAAPLTAVGQREVGGLIASTVDRWDAEDTSRRLELWLGRDLQFVRINGTLVGALVGVILHALQSVLG